jgi:DNA-binding PadR family transcriptional regulator
MSLPHAILGLLTYQPMTGYDLKHHFDHSVNYFWSAQQSQIYRELAALEGKGYVSSCIEPQEGRPDRKVYSIIAAGKRELQEWLERFPQVLTTPYREELLVHIFFASRLPLAELKFQLQRFIRERQEQLAAYTAVDGMISDPVKIPGHPDESFYWRLTLKRGFAQARADIGWAEECIRDIEKQEGLRETGDERSEER